MKLGGIIYLYDISQARLGITLNDTLNNMETFRELCDDALDAVFLMTTKWGAVDARVGKKREEELSSDFWKPMLDKGSSICRFDPTPTGAQAILNLICANYNDKLSKILQLQEVMVGMQKIIPDPNADRKLRLIFQDILNQKMRPTLQRSKINKGLQRLLTSTSNIDTIFHNALPNDIVIPYVP
jgi:hypothetical protein